MTSPVAVAVHKRGAAHPALHCALALWLAAGARGRFQAARGQLTEERGLRVSLRRPLCVRSCVCFTVSWIIVTAHNPTVECGDTVLTESVFVAQHSA